MEEDTLIADALEAIDSSQFDIVRMVDDMLEHRGITHVILRNGDEKFSLRAKEYRYKGRASFGVEQVEECDEKGYTLLSFIAESESFYVFDAAYVLSEGSIYDQSSKKSASRDWIEVPGEYGTPLPEYLADESSPDTLAGNNQTFAAF